MEPEIDCSKDPGTHSLLEVNSKLSRRHDSSACHLCPTRDDMLQCGGLILFYILERRWRICCRRIRKHPRELAEAGFEEVVDPCVK